MDPNPYESPPPLPTNSGRESTTEQLARRRVPTGPSSRWWGMLTLAIAASILASLAFSVFPGLGLLIALVAAPLLFRAASRDCRNPRSHPAQPLRLAGTIAATIGALVASGAAFAGVCVPAGTTVLAREYSNNQWIKQLDFLQGAWFVYSMLGFAGLASLGVLYAGFRTIRAARYAATNSLARSDEPH